MNAFTPRVKLAALLALLAVPLGATAALAWTLRQDAATLRSSVAQAQSERSRRAAQLAALEQRRHALERELASVTGASTPRSDTAMTPAERQRAAILEALAAIRASTEATPPPPAAPREPWGPHGNTYFPELFADAHYTQLYLAHVRARENTRYAPFFAELAAQLAPADIDRLREMLVQRQLAGEEVDGILATQALQDKRPRDVSASFRLKAEVQRQFNAELQQAFGADLLVRISEFNTLLAARQNFLERLELRLSYSSDPLTWEQTKQLAALQSEQRRAAVRAPGASGPPSQLTDEFFVAASAVLRPVQMAAFSEIRTELGASWTPGTSGSRVQISGKSGPPPGAK